MPVTVKLDTAHNAQLEIDGTVKRIRRGAFWMGLDGGTPADVLWQCVTAAGMPILAAGTPNAPYPGQSDLLYTSLRVVSTSGATASGYLIYETPSGFPATAYLIKDSSQLMTYETNMYPGTRYPIYIAGGSFDTDVDNGDGSITTTTNLVPGDNCTMRFRMRVRQKSITKLVYGQIIRPTGSFLFGNDNPFFGPQGTADNSDAVGQVNDDSWGGKPKGHWLIDGYETDTYKYQGYYILNASAICRSSPGMPNFDWSETGILRNTITGKYVQVKKDDIDALMALPYDFGQIGDNTKGVVRAGPYTLTSFPTVFGF